MIYQTNSPQETQKIAQELAKKYQKGGIFALMGPLGAGKTTFTQGFAQSLGVSQRLLSPTFILMRQYDLPENPQGKLYHIDLYRLEQINQIEELGIKEILENPANIILIEWAEKLGNLLPQNTIHIKFTQVKENSRQIEIES